MELTSERLRLRGWRNEDLDDFAAYFADEATARFVGGVCGRDEAWRRMASLVGHWELRGFGMWALEELATGDFVGAAGLWFPEGWPELEVGYWLVAAKQGRGYATEAAARARRHAFEELEAETLVSYIDAENVPSIRVAERLGAVREGTVELGKHGPHLVFRHPR